MLSLRMYCKGIVSSLYCIQESWLNTENLITASNKQASYKIYWSTLNVSEACVCVCVCVCVVCFLENFIILLISMFKAYEDIQNYKPLWRLCINSKDLKILPHAFPNMCGNTNIHFLYVHFSNFHEFSNSLNQRPSLIHLQYLPWYWIHS